MEKQNKGRTERKRVKFVCSYCEEAKRNRQRSRRTREEKKTLKKTCRQAADVWNPRMRRTNVGERSRNNSASAYQRRDAKDRKTNSRRHSNQRSRPIDLEWMEPWQRVRRRSTEDNRPPWIDRHAHVRLNTHIYDGERRVSSTSHNTSYNPNTNAGAEKAELTKQESEESFVEDTTHPRLRFPDYDQEEDGGEQEEADITHDQLRTGEEKTDDGDRAEVESGGGTGKKTKHDVDQRTILR